MSTNLSSCLSSSSQHIELKPPEKQPVFASSAEKVNQVAENTPLPNSKPKEIYLQLRGRLPSIEVGMFFAELLRDVTGASSEEAPNQKLNSSGK